MDINMITNSTMFSNVGESAHDFVTIYLMVVSSAVFLLGTVGNGLVIWFTCFKMKRTVNSVWFFSLAVADFMLSLFQPVDVIHIAMMRWPFGQFLCKLFSFIINLNLSISVLQLAVISLDRCINVIFSVWCLTHRTTKLAWKVALGVWITGFLYSLPYVILGDTRHDDSKDVCYVDPNLDREEFKSGGKLIRFILFFVIPFIVIVVSYSIIFSRIQKNSCETSSKPFKMIAVIIICFFVCWFPFHVFSLMQQYPPASMGEDLSAIYIGYEIAVGLSYINSCLNPLIYVFFGREFKENVWTSIEHTLRRAFTDVPYNPVSERAPGESVTLNTMSDG